MKYWLKVNYPQPDMGYSTGVEDKYNPAPEGAQHFDTEKARDDAALAVDNPEVVELIPADDGEIQKVYEGIQKLFALSDTQLKYLKKKYRTGQLRNLWRKNGMEGYSKLSEEALIFGLVEKGIEL